MRQCICITFGIALCAMAARAPVQAASGVLIVEKTTGAAAAPITNQIQLESNRMRAEMAGASGEKQIAVFDGARQVMMIIDQQRKSYTEITREDADRLGAQMSDAMAQMQKQLEAMPPERRAQVEAMMKGRMGGASSLVPKVKYRKAGKGQAGKWACDLYEGYEGERKTSEICTVDPKVLGLTPADFGVAQQMADFFKRLMPQMAGQVFTFGSAEQQGFAGVPVRRTFTLAGREMTSEIVDVSRQSFPDASYAVPEGYQKRSFGPAGRGR